MKLPTNLAAFAVLAGVLVAGMITGLAAAHDNVPQTLDFLATALIAGGLGNALPPPTGA